MLQQLHQIALVVNLIFIYLSPKGLFCIIQSEQFHTLQMIIATEIKKIQFFFKKNYEYIS